MTRVNLGDRKLILGRVDRQRLYLLMSVTLTDRISGEDYVSRPPSYNQSVWLVCSFNGFHQLTSLTISLPDNTVSLGPHGPSIHT